MGMDLGLTYSYRKKFTRAIKCLNKPSRRWCLNKQRMGNGSGKINNRIIKQTASLNGVHNKSPAIVIGLSIQGTITRRRHCGNGNGDGDIVDADGYYVQLPCSCHRGQDDYHTWWKNTIPGTALRELNQSVNAMSRHYARTCHDDSSESLL